MRILILGADGYLGWPTAMYLSARGHDVALADNYAKRKWEQEVGSRPLIPVPSLRLRVLKWGRTNCHMVGEFTKDVHGDISAMVDLTDAAQVDGVLRQYDPEVIVHYAEQPSAPFSMSTLERSVETQRNNVLGTLTLLWLMRELCPDAHLVKLGTMGEYGTPNIDIEEGYLDVEHNGRRDTVLFPKKPGSWYHASKVHDSQNLHFACRTWGLRATDLNQGVVYGIETDEAGPPTSFHYDAVFGTALNRFCVQAIAGEPLTVYGSGRQKRAFLNIRDTLRCVELACLHTPEAGEMRIFNQFTESFSIRDLAITVVEAAKKLGVSAEIRYLDNPRVEQDEHYYNPKAEHLPRLGLEPHLLGDELVQSMLRCIQEHKDRIDKSMLMPSVTWR